MVKAYNDDPPDIAAQMKAILFEKIVNAQFYNGNAQQDQPYILKYSRRGKVKAIVEAEKRKYDQNKNHALPPQQGNNLGQMGKAVDLIKPNTQGEDKPRQGKPNHVVEKRKMVPKKVVGKKVDKEKVHRV